MASNTRQAAALAPVLLVLYAVAKTLSGSTQLIQVPQVALLLLLALAILAGLIVSMHSPGQGIVSLIVTLVLGYGLHTTGYLPALGLALVAGAHLAGLAIAVLRGEELDLGAAISPGDTTPSSSLVDELESFNPVRARDEEDVENQLYQYLTAEGYNVEKQPFIDDNLRPDLRVEDCIIEIKIPQNRGDLQRLLGQAEDYLEHEDCLIIYLIDAGIMPLETLQAYKRKLEEKGARVVVKSI